MCVPVCTCVCAFSIAEVGGCRTEAGLVGAGSVDAVLVSVLKTKLPVFRLPVAGPKPDPEGDQAVFLFTGPGGCTQASS